MKHGIAISTYFPKNYRAGRLEIFTRSIRSLLDSNFPGKIFIVDDGSDVVDHLDVLKTEDYDHRIRVILKPKNSGIARTKNTCIRTLLDHGCPIGFLADDDLEYHTGWAEHYINSMKLANIPHFSLFIEPGHEDVEYNGHTIRRTPHVNGCFLTFTKDLIESVGYFKDLPYKYGHEHSNFSIRNTMMGKIPYYCDVVDSEKYLTLIPESVEIKSLLEIDEEQFKNNESIATQEFAKEPFID
jgi:glycosyltransferase involved in cell wall biosynthesis